jgi:hypothetical protein
MAQQKRVVQQAFTKILQLSPMAQPSLIVFRHQVKDHTSWEKIVKKLEKLADLFGEQRLYEQQFLLLEAILKIKNMHQYNHKKDDIVILLEEMIEVAHLLLATHGSVEFLEKCVQWMKKQDVPSKKIVKVMKIVASVYRELYGDLKNAVRIMQQVDVIQGTSNNKKILQQWKRHEMEIAKWREQLGKKLSRNPTKHRLQKQGQAQLLEKIVKCDQELLALQTHGSSSMKKQAQRQEYVKQLLTLRGDGDVPP